MTLTTRGATAWRPPYRGEYAVLRRRPGRVGAVRLGSVTMDRQGTDDAAMAELYRLRESIDNLDAALVHVLAERFRCTQAVGVLKAEHAMPPADPEREAQQIERLRRLAQEAHL